MQKQLLVASIERAGYSGFFEIEKIPLSLSEGDVVLVTGRSGSGKTTLLKAITGLITVENGFVEGRVLVNSRDVTGNPVEALKQMFYIPQEPWYGVTGYTVIADYCHTLSVYGKKCKPSDLASYRLEHLRDSVVYSLSAGQTQSLLWAEALETETKILLLDEPYTYLDRENRWFFKKLVDKTLSNGYGVLVVDHLPHNWVEYEPYTIVLDKGRVVYNGRFSEKIHNVITLKNPKKIIAEPSSEEVLIARDIWFKYPGSQPILRSINLVVRRGEVIGIRGRNGVGKSTLLKILAGIYKPVKGVIEKRGETAYIPENPLLFYTQPTIREELLSSGKSWNVVRDVVEKLDLEHILDKPLAKLSTGERRRGALASAILRGYRVLLLDEPTGGLDYYSVEQLLDLLEKLVREGCSVVITHHDPRLDGLLSRECELESGVLKCS
ncbi:MAG: ATP-binding cassette domain-containing protein [Thermoprotei archaeon]